MKFSLKVQYLDSFGFIDTAYLAEINPSEILTEDISKAMKLSKLEAEGMKRMIEKYSDYSIEIIENN
jgi:hypothetical protein